MRYQRYPLGYLADIDHHLRFGSLPHRSSRIPDHLRVSLALAASVTNSTRLLTRQ